MAKASYATRATSYARKVVAGKIDACLYVRQACQRHLDDLESAREKGYPFEFNPTLKSSRGKDYRPVERVCAFAERMVHVKGKWKGQPIVLEDWECFFLAMIFGWTRKADSLRRFRIVYAEIPRKNAKSTVAAIIGLYLAFVEGEPGAEVYSGATSLEQAGHVFNTAWNMVRLNPGFRESLGLSLGGTDSNPTTIFQLSTGSKFTPVIGKPGDGAMPHCAIIDEYHEHKTPDLYNTMQTGMGARTQPLQLVITTAGFDISGPCHGQRDKAVGVLGGSIEDDALFAIVYTIDDGDSWEDFACWKKANPNFGVSVFTDYLKGQHKTAMQVPAERNDRLTKHLNVWCNVGVGAFDMLAWSKCADQSLDMAEFEGCECFAALDLASRVDLAALLLLFRDKASSDRWTVFARFYLPAATVERPENAHWRKWVAEGWLTATEGARTDFSVIEEDLRAFAERFVIRELIYDPKEATMLVNNVSEWASFELVEMPQSPAYISEPMKELEAVIRTEKIRHNNPILTWNVGNVVRKRGLGPTKSYYPAKEKDELKIDGAVCLIMALKRALVAEPQSEFFVEVW